MLKFSCSSCGEDITTRFSKPGDSIQCLSCKADVIVPAEAIDVGNLGEEEYSFSFEKHKNVDMNSEGTAKITDNQINTKEFKREKEKLGSKNHQFINRNIITFIIVSCIYWIFYEFYFLISHIKDIPLNIGSIIYFSIIIVPVVLLILSKRIISNLLESEYSNGMKKILSILIILSIIWISHELSSSFFMYRNDFYFNFDNFRGALISIFMFTANLSVLLPASLLFFLIFKRRSHITSVFMLVCSVFVAFRYLSYLCLGSFFYEVGIGIGDILYGTQIVVPISLLFVSLFFIKRNNKRLGSTINQNICPNCGAITPVLSKFCTKCGTKIEDIKINQSSEELFGKCAECGNVLKEGQKFCTKCGNKIEDIK